MVFLHHANPAACGWQSDSRLDGEFCTRRAKALTGEAGMNPLTDLFLTSLWPGLAVWIALYISDYSFTLKCARMYQGTVRDKIAFEGSYELTPIFQADIDSLRVISPRF